MKAHSKNAILFEEQDEELPLWDHLNSLRSTLIRIFLTVAIGFFLSFLFHDSLTKIASYPLMTSNPSLQMKEIKQQRVENRSNQPIFYQLPIESSLLYQTPDVTSVSPSLFSLPPKSYLEISLPQLPLTLLGPLEGMKTTFKICFWVGLVGSSPLWLFWMIQFVSPAIAKQQRRSIFPFFFLSLLFLIAGAIFAYWITLPFANQMLYAFNKEIGNNLWSFDSYVDYTSLLLLANGLAFEMAFVLFFLVHMGCLSLESMREKRRLMILVAFILGALLTPPDIFTQFALALPLVGLYELALLYARFKFR